MKRLLVLLALGVLSAHGATTVLNPTMNQAALQAIISAAIPGDTIVFAKGTYSIGATPLVLKCGVTYTGAIANAGLVMSVSASQCAATSFWSLSMAPTEKPTSTFLTGPVVMAVGGTAWFMTVANYADQPQGALSASTYASNAPNVCAVTNGGLVMAIGTGVCQISSTADGVVSGRLTITVR